MLMEFFTIVAHVYVGEVLIGVQLNRIGETVLLDPRTGHPVGYDTCFGRNTTGWSKLKIVSYSIDGVLMSENNAFQWWETVGETARMAEIAMNAQGYMPWSSAT